MLIPQNKMILTGDSYPSPKFTSDKRVSIRITPTLYKSVGGMDVVILFNAKKNEERE